MRIQPVLKPLAAAVVICSGSFSVNAVAQALVLEEIIVTSQLRAESLQDVSVSVSAVTGDKLMEAGISKIEDLQSFVPNLTMSETGIGTNIYIRGIGSGINQGFEQSVGMYVDGVYYGRAQLSRAPFLDLERVEVMRGPQNILYGKNSIAGAMSVVTNKPSDEFEGLVSATIEPEYGEQVFDIVLSGGLSDTISARLAHRSRDLDGYIENIDGGDEPERDEDTTRLTLVWDINDNLDATLKYEHGTFDVLGRQIEILGDAPSLNPALGGANWGQFLQSLNPLTAITNADVTPASINNTRANAANINISTDTCFRHG
jgi:outer membrane receptor protein involved in Fe transport